MELGGRRSQSWGELAARLSGGDVAPTPFQTGAWLPAWYATFGAQGDVVPLPIEIFDKASGRTIAGLPLIQRQVKNFSVVEFADFTMTDYSAPVVLAAGPAAPAQWLSALYEALPRADILNFTKMPMRLNGALNPLAQLPGAQSSELSANFVCVGDSWERYRRDTLTKKFRKKMERSLRVFERDGANARFEMIADRDVAEWVLLEMEQLQEARISELGLEFCLNDAPYRAFFRELIATGLADGTVILTALRSGPDKLVAALMGIRHGEKYAMVRLAQDGKNWSQCSPGKLMIERTMHMLHGKGVRMFDFTTGDYRYKRNFCVDQAPLIDVRLPLSLRGRMKLQADVLRENVKTRLRRHPRVFEALKSLKGGGGNA